MGDYIKREDALRIFCEECVRDSEKQTCDVQCCGFQKMHDLPAADVRENVRGEWELVNKLPDRDGKWVRCSVCRRSEHFEYNNAKLTWKFCPNCGADMRKE